MSSTITIKHSNAEPIPVDSEVVFTIDGAEYNVRIQGNGIQVRKVNFGAGTEEMTVLPKSCNLISIV